MIRTMAQSCRLISEMKKDDLKSMLSKNHNNQHHQCKPLTNLSRHETGPGVDEEVDGEKGVPAVV